MRRHSLFPLAILLVFAGVFWGDDAKLYVELGHAAAIETVALSADGRFALTGGVDSLARFWDVATGKELRRFAGHTNAVCSVGFSPDGSLVVTGSWDSTARLWDAMTGVEIRRLIHPNMVLSTAFSPDRRFLVTGGGDHVVRLWSVATGAEVRHFSGHGQQVNAVAYSPDGRYVLSGGGVGSETETHDYSVRLWDAGTGALVRQFAGHSGAVVSVGFSPDGRTIVSAGSDDGTARIWDVRSGAELQRLTVPSRLSQFKHLEGNDRYEFIESAAFSADGRYLLTCHNDGVRLWDVDPVREIHHFTAKLDPRRAVLSTDGRLILATTGNSGILWDSASGKEIRRLASHADVIWTAAHSRNGRFLATAYRSVQIWDLVAGAEVRRIDGSGTFSLDLIVKSVAFSPDNRFLVASGGLGNASLFDTGTGAVVRQFQHAGSEAQFAFSPDGSMVVAVSDTEGVMFAAATGSEMRRFGKPGNTRDGVACVAFSPDSRWILTGTNRTAARIWNAATGAEVRRLEGAPADPNAPEGSLLRSPGVLSVAFSADGRSILTGGMDRTARLWDAATGAEIRRFSGHDGTIKALAFSPDGRLAVTGSTDNTARVWDVASGRELHRLDGHTDNLVTTVFTPDGRFVMTTSADATTRLWSPSSGAELASIISYDRGWAVAAPDGRFDSSDLDGRAPLHWALSSDPLSALPLEIFMRDYYTPRLLARIMAGEKLPPLPGIASIQNRLQPRVEVVRIEPSPAHPNRVNVWVHAASTIAKNQRSGLQDLRLFRNGQMVGHLEGPLRDDTYKFTEVPLPVSANKVAFTAYAFNAARIKSATAERAFEYAPSGAPRPKAYLVQIGVNHYQASGCELRYAVNDARRLHTVLEERLRARGLEVHDVELISDAGTATATRNGIRLALADIASRATPDDVFFLSFSGHGYTKPNGEFYLMPADIQGACSTPNLRLLLNAVSADDLTEWLRPIDAGEMTFILDACYSAASVEANDFKPGPMGSHGLGQLAYDKRMRILAASQSDERAQEDSRLGQGLLSYVLTEEGLVKGEADWRPKDRQITIGEWLAYAVDAVPKLGTAPDGDDAHRGFGIEQARRVQLPALFDFSRQDVFVIQK